MNLFYKMMINEGCSHPFIPSLVSHKVCFVVAWHLVFRDKWMTNVFQSIYRNTTGEATIFIHVNTTCIITIVYIGLSMIFCDNTCSLHAVFLYN